MNREVPFEFTQGGGRPQGSSRTKGGDSASSASVPDQSCSSGRAGMSAAERARAAMEAARARGDMNASVAPAFDRATTRPMPIPSSALRPAVAEAVAPPDGDAVPYHGNGISFCTILLDVRALVFRKYARNILVNAKLEVGLPYEDLNTLITNGKLKISNASKWLTERYYRNESGYDTIDPNVIPDYVIEANKIIFDLGKLEARTGGSLQFHRTFDTNEEFNNAIKDTKATAEMKGKWNFDNLVLPGNSTVYKYKINETKESNIDENDYKSRQKVYYNEDGTPTKNGYIVGEDISIVKQGKDGACDIITVKKKINDKVNLNASAKIDTRLKDYSNNGYTERIINPNNHSITTETEKKAAEKLSGPGNLEVHHWQDGSNESTKQQHWRFVFATDYAIQNGKITVKLPYELKDNYTIEDTTNWLVNRYYPAVTGKKFYSDLNVVNKDTYKSKIQIDGDNLTIDVGDIPARTALSFTVHKKFATPQDFSNDIKEARINVSGNWRLDEKYIKLPTTKITHDIKCGTCELPNIPTPNRPVPNKPEEPKNPEPNKPEEPKNPEPNKPVEPKNPEPNKPVEPKSPVPSKPVPNKYVPGKPQVTYKKTKVSENNVPNL